MTADNSPLGGAEHRVATAFSEVARTANALAGQVGPPLARAADVLEICLRAGNKVLACGNGGSAADAQHFVAELVGRYGFDRPGLPALALSVDTSVMTSVSNDYGYDEVFARQVGALGRAGDVLLGITTSGRSQSVLRAVARAHERGMQTIAMLGAAVPEPLAGCTVCLTVPSTHTPRIQEMHAVMLHLLCEFVEERLFGRP